MSRRAETNPAGSHHGGNHSEDEPESSRAGRLSDTTWIVYVEGRLVSAIVRESPPFEEFDVARAMRQIDAPAVRFIAEIESLRQKTGSRALVTRAATAVLDAWKQAVRDTARR